MAEQDADLPGPKAPEEPADFMQVLVQQGVPSDIADSILAHNFDSKPFALCALQEFIDQIGLEVGREITRREMASIRATWITCKDQFTPSCTEARCCRRSINSQSNVAN